MTKLMEEVLKKVSKLDDSEQNAIAGLLSQELSWAAVFEKTQKELESLANEALEEYKLGKTKPLRLK